MPRGQGRPSYAIEINFNHPLDSIEEIKSLSEIESIRENIINFATSLLSLANVKLDANFLIRHVLNNYTKEIFVESVCHASNQMAIYEKSHLISNLFFNFPEVDKCKLLYFMYCNMSFEGQCDIFSFLGSSLNDDLKVKSVESIKKCSDLSINNLKKATKEKLYDECDGRLKNFIDSLTQKKWINSEVENNTHNKANAYENLLKARNSKYVSDIGLKEHMVVYLASGKSMHASQVFSKQGGKGTRPLLELILQKTGGSWGGGTDRF